MQQRRQLLRILPRLLQIAPPRPLIPGGLLLQEALVHALAVLLGRWPVHARTDVSVPGGAGGRAGRLHDDRVTLTRVVPLPALHGLAVHAEETRLAPALAVRLVIVRIDESVLGYPSWCRSGVVVLGGVGGSRGGEQLICGLGVYESFVGLFEGVYPSCDDVSKKNPSLAGRADVRGSVRTSLCGDRFSVWVFGSCGDGEIALGPVSASLEALPASPEDVEDPDSWRWLEDWTARVDSEDVMVIEPRAAASMPSSFSHSRRGRNISLEPDQ